MDVKKNAIDFIASDAEDEDLYAAYDAIMEYEDALAYLESLHIDADDIDVYKQDIERELEKREEYE